MGLCMNRQAMCAHSALTESISTHGPTTFSGKICFYPMFMGYKADQSHRHVRVHHQDRSRDDPELRQVLAQRPEGGSRGRRRRVGG